MPLLLDLIYSRKKKKKKKKPSEFPARTCLGGSLCDFLPLLSPKDPLRRTCLRDPSNLLTTSVSARILLLRQPAPCSCIRAFHLLDFPPAPTSLRAPDAELSTFTVSLLLRSPARGFGVMLLDQAALCNQAAMLESMKLKESKFPPAFMSELEAFLLDVYASILPSASEYEQRKQLVQTFNMTAKNIFGDTRGFSGVVAFGSFIMNIFTAKSDLDLSINFSSSNDSHLTRSRVVSILRRFAKVLREEPSKGHLSRVLLVQHAKVPVLKAVDCKTGIECDISVENKDGISRSLFYSIIFSVDERFCIMSYLMKAWAKANDINSSRHNTMNSVSIISLVALHFQTRDPPILPPFSTLLRDGADITNLPNAVLELKEFAKRNNESVAELFVSLLAKLISVEKLWELGLCASTYEGSWISKTLNSKGSCTMNVEDFQDRAQNFARSVGKSKMPKIYNCLRESLGHLSSSMKCQIEMSELRTLLFGPISLHTQHKHVYPNTNQKLPIKPILTPVGTIALNPNTSTTAKAGMTLKPMLLPRKTAVGRTNHAGLKRKNTSTEFSPPSAPTNRANMNNWLSQKPRPYPELPFQSHVNEIALKRPCHENQNYMQFPIPMIHPSPSYIPQSASQPLISSNMGHGSYQHIQHPFIYHLPSSSHGQHPLQFHAAVPEASGMLQHFPNMVHPRMSSEIGHPNMFPGYTARYGNNNAGYAPYSILPRSFSSNHP